MHIACPRPPPGRSVFWQLGVEEAIPLPRFEGSSPLLLATTSSPCQQQLAMQRVEAGCRMRGHLSRRHDVVSVHASRGRREGHAAAAPATHSRVLSRSGSHALPGDAAPSARTRPVCARTTSGRVRAGDAGGAQQAPESCPKKRRPTSGLLSYVRRSLAKDLSVEKSPSLMQI